MKRVKGIDTLEGVELFWDDIDTGTFGYYTSPTNHSGPVGDWVHSHKEIVNNLKRKGVCVQAGGAMGLYPLLLSSIFDKVYTFEPYVPSFEILCKNVDALNIHNVYPQCFGLGANEEKGVVHVRTNTNLGSNMVKINKDGDVHIRKLDSFSFGKVDFLWLDIEGFEEHAIAGAHELIKRDMPVIALESLHTETIIFLEQLGYSPPKKSMMDNFFYPPNY